MKLRLHAGSMRLRLSQSEVAQVHDTGKVEDAVVFAPGKELVYSLERFEFPEACVTFDDSRIRVRLPKPILSHWAESDEVGIDIATESLKILIEKDFQCLHREPEPGEDSFPNPLAEQR
jgi:hypothetical protein